MSQATDIKTPICPKCSTCLTTQEIWHTMCRTCAETDMARRLGAGLMDLPDDWYDDTPEWGPQPALKIKTA